MKLLAIADVHADPVRCAELSARVKAEHYDAILGVGDWYDGVREAQPDNLLRAIADMGIPLFFVTGNHESTAVMNEWRGIAGLDLRVLDEQAVLWQGMVLCGIGHGGESAIIGGNRGPVVRPRLTKLDTAWRGIADGELPATRILLTHEPPWQHNRLYLAQKQEARDSGNKHIDMWARAHRITHIVCGHYHQDKAYSAMADDAVVCNPGPYGFELELP